MKYTRVLLKLSGEALMGNQQYGIDPERLNDYAEEIAEASKQAQIAIVIGGGNIFRGLQGASKGMDRIQGDYMGMLATVINSMALQSTLQAKGVKTPDNRAVFTPLACKVDCKAMLLMTVASIPI